MAMFSSPGGVLQDKFLIFVDSDEGSILQTSILGSEAEILYHDPLGSPVGVDYDSLNRKIYWTDVDRSRIMRMNLEGSEVETVLQLTTASVPEAVAVDPVAGLLFYSDSGPDTIEIANLDGSKRRTVVLSAQQPRGLSLDPVRSRIESHHQGGYTGQTGVWVASNLAPMTALTGQWSNRGLMFWTDRTAMAIMVARTNGDNQSKLLLSGDVILDNTNVSMNVAFYGVSVDAQNIFFTDWNSGTLFKANRDGSNIKIVYTQANRSSLASVVAYDSDSHPLGSNTACNTLNGGCSDLCVPRNDRVVCMCPEFKRIAHDEKTCLREDQANGPDMIWVEHDSYATSYIKGIKGEPEDYLRTKEMKTWVIRSPAWHWTALDMNYKNNMLYLTDKQDRFIVQMPLNGSIEIQVIYYGISTGVGGVAVDWVAGNIYWTDSFYNWIMMSKAAEKTPYQKTLINTGLDSPHGIAVWPQKGLLLWTDWGTVPKIEFSKLNGQGRQILWEQELDEPKGLAIDYALNRVFWCNQHSVNSVAFDGRRATDYQYHGGFSDVKFVDIALHMDYVFATDKRAQGISQLWFYDRRQKPSEGRKLSLKNKPYGATMYDQRRQESIASQCSDLKCEHICITLGVGQSECACSDGYDIQPDERTCTENINIIKHATYIYSLGNRICSLAIKDSLGPLPDPDSQCFFESDQYEFRALAFDFLGGEIFFSDVKHQVKSIRKAHMIAKDNNSAIVQGVGVVNGIAIEWVSNNIYWTDATHDQIWMARSDGSYQKVLANHLETPHGLALDLLRKKLYWSEQGKEGILMAGLEGNEAALVYSRPGSRPGGMVVDYDDDKLYWVDLNTQSVESIDLDTKQHLEHDIHSDDFKFYDIATFQDYFIFTGSKYGNASGVRIFDKKSGQPATNGVFHKSPNTAYDVIAFVDQHYSSLAAGDGCAVDNGGCEQLCIQDVQSFRCVCVDGYQINGNGRSCRSLPLLQDNFFLMADDYRYQIYQADHQMQSIRAVKTPRTDRPIALTYDFLENRIYWTDFRENVVKRSFLNGSDPAIIRFKDNNSRIDGLAFEPISRLLYFTDTGRNEIGVMNPTGVNRKILVRDATVIHRPRGIALDSINGHMYYTVRDVRGGRIERRSMDGSGLVILVSEMLASPSGITLDLEGDCSNTPQSDYIIIYNQITARKMYWCDAHSEKVESASLLGNDRKTLISLSADGDPFGIATQGQYIYWTDWNIRGVHRSLKDGENDVVLHDDFFSGLNDIKYFNKTALPKSTACSDDNGGCSDFCLPLPNNQRACGCPDSYEGNIQLTTDGLNCQRVDTCEEDIPNGVWSDECTRQVGASCSYQCDAGFGQTKSQHIRCGRNRKWEAVVTELCTDRTCPFLLTPPNAKQETPCVGIVGPSVQCIHECKSGFIQKGGDQLRTCGEDLLWTGHPIICIAQELCSVLSTPTNAVANPVECGSEQRPVGSVCYHMCRHGYTMVSGIGSYERACTSTGRWTGSSILCRINEPDTQPSTHEDKSLPIPLLAGVFAGIIVLLVLLAAILFFLWRKRTAKNRNDRLPANPPSYDAHRGIVSLNDQTPSYENPVYARHSDLQNYQNEAAAVASPARQPPVEKPALEGAEAGPLPVKEPLDDDDIKLIDDDEQFFGVENPAFVKKGC
ncbi:hypothetical protein CAPTEDRAFT_227414 [Capitella teleta]|uniref:Sushi domain-containing protein n=1 Tax=Capitella teleta TaxID=283909 RepID=R7U3E4_CAPTE|nr:hypothetical protein CAPTEDRAFT_227414 [Capitella teleta]|eukprot:ELT98196.1 hypothetical protein CAPTEDRAFT_227414 [Capitella teleta]